jgi:hypothetical protein
MTVSVATVTVKVDVATVLNKVVAAAVLMQVWRGTGYLEEQNVSAGA